MACTVGDRPGTGLRAIQEVVMTKLAKTFAPLAAVAAVLCAVAANAATQNPTVRNVRIAVIDPATGDELGVLTPGQEIALAPGEQRIFRLFTEDRAQGRLTLGGNFGLGPTASPLQIVGTPGRGEVRIQLDDAAVGQRFPLGWKLGDQIPVSDEALRLGRIMVRVVSTPGVGTAPILQYPGRVPATVVTVLYRAILMRDPEAGGASGSIDDIARNGYDGVLRVANTIANSEESRSRIYVDRNVTNEQRLEALYRELLGMRRTDVSASQWESDLVQLGRGNIAGVVDAIVRSEQFRTRFGF
jgi:hypothetical protein